MADSGGGEQGIFVTIGGTSVPLQEALDAAIPKLGELQDALRRTEEAGSGGVGGGGGGFLGGGFGGGFLGMLGDAGHSLDFLGGALGGAAEKLMAFGSQMWAVTGGMVAFNALSDATQKVQEFADSLVQLNITAENTQFGWGFMFGDMQRAPGGGPDSPFTDVSGKSQKLYDWAQQYSMQIPFTRFDEMGAISMLGTVPRDDNGNNLTPEDVEHYLPIIADIASTWGKTAYGGRGVDLNQAAYIIQQAVEGRSIMLKRDLKINPEDLIKYGLDASGTGTGIHINDKSTLLPALEKWAEAHHLSGGENDSQGAARAAAHQTFSGEWSSFIDRIQLFEQTGGQELFKDLKGDLEGISSWWDQHKPDMDALAKLFGQDLGQGLHFAGIGLQGLFQGLANSPLGQQILNDMQQSAAWLADPKHQQEIQALTADLGKLAGTDLSGLLTALGGVKDGLANIAKSITPEERQQITQFFQTDLPNALRESGMDAANFGKVIGDINKLLSDQQSGKDTSADNLNLSHDSQIFAYEFMTGKPVGPGFQFQDGSYADPYAAVKSGAVHAQPYIGILINGQDLVFTPKDYIAQDDGTVSVTYTYVDPVDGKTKMCGQEDIQATIAYVNSRLARYGALGASPFSNAQITGGALPTAAIGAARAAAVDQSRSGPPVTTTSSAAVLEGQDDSTTFSDLGQQHASAYLTAFNSTVKDQTGPDLVQAFTDGVNRQLSNGSGDVLASRLATFIDQRTRQAIADALANMDLTSNGSRTQAGGPGHQAFTPY